MLNFRENFSKHLALPLQDLLRGTNIRGEYAELLHTDKLTIAELEKIQITKLKRLVHYSYENIPYYRDIFESVNLHPSEINSLRDLGKVPITDKDMAREAGESLYIPSSLKKNIKYGKTGGTTGIPLFYKKDAKTRSVGWGAYFRWLDSIGVKSSSSKVSLWGAPTVLDTTFTKTLFERSKNWINNTIVINSFNINSKTLPKIVRIIEEKNPEIIHGYLSAILQLAYFLDVNNIKTINPKVILPTTETLLPPYRIFLEKIFGCEVFDQYGCGECGSIAFECDKHSGLHVAMEHCIMEIVDKDSKGRGDVVVTDLDNMAMPFIRYRNGDQAEFTSTKCSCGRNSPLVKNILGRNTDTIILNDGSKVHGVFFTDIMGEFNFVENKEIRRFQVYQRVPGSIDFKIEGNYLNPKNEDLLSKALRGYFDNVTITYHNYLNEDSSGKFRYVVSEVGID